MRELEAPQGTPPQLRLLLGRLDEARRSSEPAMVELDRVLYHMLRFFTGLALQALQNEGTCVPAQLRAMRAQAETVAGAEKVFKSAVNSLSSRVRSWRSEQLLELFFGGIERPENRTLARWLGLGGEPHPAPLLSARPRGESLLEPSVELIADWLTEAAPIFSEEVWTLDREVATLVGSAIPSSRTRTKPLPVPGDPMSVEQAHLTEVVESWAALVLEPPLPLDDEALMDLLRHYLLAIETRAAGYLARNAFELAEHDYEALTGYAHGARGRHPLASILANAMGGRGRCRSCQGHFDEAERDFEIALRMHRELLNREPTPQGAAALAWALLYRALNQRCQGRVELALSDLDVASQFAELAPGDDLLKQALARERSTMQPSAKTMTYLNEEIQLLKSQGAASAQLELACALVERSMRLDPQLKDTRALSDRKNALTILKKLRKNDPGLTVSALRNRPCRWGRSPHDLAVWESDLRLVRACAEVLNEDPDLNSFLRDALELAEGMLQHSFFPEGFLNELFELFTDLANRDARHYEPGWQAEHWMRLRVHFADRGDYDRAIRCMVMEAVALRRRSSEEDVMSLVVLLDTLGQVLEAAPVSVGLEPLGPSFRMVNSYRARYPELRAPIQAMANRWRALPLMIPARAGADRPLLAALAEG
ncbi:MAG: hypothetical protein AMXMBFR33_11840 [Candidatus Xenobia bacterium]